MSFWSYTPTWWQWGIAAVLCLAALGLDRIRADRP